MIPHHRPYLLTTALLALAVFPAFAQGQRLGEPRYDKTDTEVPQYVLSTCTALAPAITEIVLPGTGMAVSPDGQFRVTWVNTPGGAELTLLNRDTQDQHYIALPAPVLSPGVAWRVLEARFSPDSHLLAIRSVGQIWVADAAAATLLYSINVDKDKQLWPGSFTWSDKFLGVTFWPPESVLADAPVKTPVIFDMYEAASGAGTHALPLDLASSDAWLEPALSPDASHIAVLERARTWPGSARLLLLDVATGRVKWERKISAEDIAWSADGSQILALGSRLMWLSSKDGRKMRESASDAGSSEYQRIKFNEQAGIAVASFSLYSSFHRLFSKHPQEQPLIVLWNLKSGEELCRKAPEASSSFDPWVTTRGEIVALEETYSVRPPLRLLESARIVTYKIVLPEGKQATPVNSQPAAPARTSTSQENAEPAPAVQPPPTQSAQPQQQTPAETPNPPSSEHPPGL
jgi:dipeptidyl aminopeptidase/acylaminoacyl peptidase